MAPEVRSSKGASLVKNRAAFCWRRQGRLFQLLDASDLPWLLTLFTSLQSQQCVAHSYAAISLVLNLLAPSSTYKDAHAYTGLLR